MTVPAVDKPLILLVDDIPANLHVLATALKGDYRIKTAPYQIDGRPLYSSPSAGISLSPQDGDTPATLLQLADSAMYQAKQAGRGRYLFHENL